MRDKAFKDKQLKHKVYGLRNKGEKNAVMRLNREQVEYLRHFCIVTPYLYKVNKAFRPGFDRKKAPSVLKRIYFAKNNPVFLVMDDKEVEICRNAGLNPVPHKYMVHLDTLK